jgi:peptidoglycan hydrolase CwlO-like protein|tara:strand:- start:454 stop:858 length:405 start_codon:yes stop_codon:yes gene_type:complete
MSLMAFKLALKKAWVWCKHHWKILLLAAWTIAIWIISRRGLNSHKKVLDAAIKNYESEIEVIQSAHEKEIDKRNKAIETYQAVLSEAEKNYKDSQQELGIMKKERLKDLVNQYADDPESLNSAIEAEFGFRYVK